MRLGLPSPEGEGGSQRETDEVLMKNLILHLSIGKKMFIFINPIDRITVKILE